MKNEAIAIHSLLQEILTQLGCIEKRGRLMDDAAVLTLSIVAAKNYCGNQKLALKWAKDFPDVFSHVLCPSRFGRRLAQLDDILDDIQAQLNGFFECLKCCARYILDSFPVSFCHNARIKRCKIAEFVEFRGYCASKKEYFYGQKAQVIISETGVVTETFIHPGSWHDVCAFEEMSFNLPAGSQLYADKGYNSQDQEQKLEQEKNIKPMFLYKKNKKNPENPEITQEKQNIRKYIETVFSQITAKFGKRIHAVTFSGFERKLKIFFLQHNIDKYFQFKQ